MIELEKINLTSQPTKKLLEKRQLEDYLSYQKQLARWLLNLGKDPKKAESYSRETVKRSIYYIDSFHRFIWKKLEEKCTLNVKPSHADDYMKHIAYQDFENSYKHSVQKSWKRYFKYKKKELREQE